MKIMSREKFLALEGSVLFCEVDIVEDGDNVRVIPKPFSDPLMVRSEPTDDVYYEGSIATHSLSNMFIYLNEEDKKWASFDHPIDLDQCRGDKDQQYFLVYDKKDVIEIIKNLSECL